MTVTRLVAERLAYSYNLSRLDVEMHAYTIERGDQAALPHTLRLLYDWTPDVANRFMTDLSAAMAG